MRDDVETATCDLSEDLRIEDLADERNSADQASLLQMVGISGGSGAASQGNYVSSFQMTPRDEAQAIARAATQLPLLLAECDPSQSDDHSDDDPWRRVRGKKGSRVKLWEKGSASSLTPQGGRRKSAPVSPQQPQQQSQRHRTATSEPPAVALLLAGRERYAVRSSITVQASMASVLKALDCSLATSYRSFTKIIYENLVSDTSVLSHKQLPQGGDPHVDHQQQQQQQPHLHDALAVRWLVCKCTSPLVSDCDLCLLEYSKIHSVDELQAAGAAPSNNRADSEDEHARVQSNGGLRARDTLPKAYKIWSSMETKHCPMLCDAPHHLVRVHVPLGGFLLYTTDNEDTTDVVFYMAATYDKKKSSFSSMTGTTTHTTSGYAAGSSTMASASSSSSSSNNFLSSDDRQFRAIQQMMQQMALALDRISNAVDAYTMSLQLETLRSAKWIENSNRSECIVCYRRFHPITRRRHHCRLCGDIICRACSVHKDADLPTVGPTTLRICKLCNVQHFSRSSVMASIASDVKRQHPHHQHQQHQQSSSAAARQLRREALLETTTFDSPTTATQRMRRQSLLSIETSNASRSSKYEAEEPTETKTSTATAEEEEENRARLLRSHRVRRHSVDQPMSCPKPSSQRGSSGSNNNNTVKSPSPLVSPVAGTTKKWPLAFHANRSSAHPGTAVHRGHQPLLLVSSPQAKFARTLPLPHSVSKDPQSSHRFNFGLMKSGMPLSPQPSPHHMRPRGQSSIDSLCSPQGQSKTTPVQFSSPVSTKPVSVSDAMMKKSNQTQEAPPPEKRGSSGSSSSSGGGGGGISLNRRATIQNASQYEDLLRELCERASEATTAKYAAVSIFIAPDDSRETASDGTLTMAHYLKVDGSPKLMKIAANMRCCEPVLRALRAVVTRNALTCTIDGLEMGSLPFVKGPQQARFYAGIPLVDSKQRLFGALAVFDAKFEDDEEDLLDSTGLLESIARATTARVEAKRAETALKAFMKTPLLRQTEPTLTAVHHGGGGGKDGFNNNEQWDGENDEEEDDDEEHVRTVTRFTAVPKTMQQQQPNSKTKRDSLEYYKRQMHRLVQQANQTQGQVLQNAHAMHTHGVSY